MASAPPGGAAGGAGGVGEGGGERAVGSFTVRNGQGPRLLKQKTESSITQPGDVRSKGGAAAGGEGPVGATMMREGRGGWMLRQKTEPSLALSGEVESDRLAGGDSARVSMVNKGGRARLLKQKTESFITLPGDGELGGGPERISMARKSGLLGPEAGSFASQVGGRVSGVGRGLVRVSMLQRHAAGGEEVTGSSSRNRNGSSNLSRTTRDVSGDSAGGAGEKPASRRPQRYHKIKMKTTAAASNSKRPMAQIPIRKESTSKTGRNSASNNARDWPVKLPFRTTGGTFSALAVAHKVASGFRGDPDWATGVSRSAKRR